MKDKRVKVIGVGGNGCQMINYLSKIRVDNLYTIAIDTDVNTLIATNAHKRLLIGENLVKGQGTSGNFEIGSISAEESSEEIRGVLSDSEIIFVIAGLGGGVGTGAGPIIASMAYDAGIITIGALSYPFNFEGKSRIRAAQIGIQKFTNGTNALIVVSNEDYLETNELSAKDTLETFKNIFCMNVIGLTDLVTIPGLINLDKNDIRGALEKWKSASIGYGYATGTNRVNIAVQNAIQKMAGQLKLENSKSIIFSITGGPSLSLFEVNEVAHIIREKTQAEDFIFGAIIDPALEDTMQITIFATGEQGIENNIPIATTSFSKTSHNEGAFISKRQIKVFLCHSSNDKTTVRKLYQRLFSRSSIDVWLDEARLLPGENWNHEITKAVKDSDIVIVCLSKNSVSKEGYIQREIKLALDIADEKPEGTIFIVPLKLEECEVPDRLSNWQWVNYYEDGSFNLLIKSLRKRAETLGITFD